ncbi:MAG: type-F conjugative transfer system pilin assembly protein TraF [Candidatus Nitrosotenuis sp.]
MIKRLSFKNNYFIVLFLIILPLVTNAQDYYEQHAVGWHWYDDPKLENKPENNYDNPVLQMKSIRQTLEFALDKAILNPTLENVKDYIILQNQVGERSNAFSRAWEWVLLQNPLLDYSIKHPTNQAGRQVYLDKLNEQQDNAIKNLSKNSGFFFFYRSSCPYCQRFSPIVKNFSQRYGIMVIPITTDGIALPEFPESRMDQGQARKFNVMVEPALFTVNPYTHQAIPVSYGLISEDDLRQRILNIATHTQQEVKS